MKWGLMTTKWAWDETTKLGQYRRKYRREVNVQSNSKNANFDNLVRRTFYRRYGCAPVAIYHLIGHLFSWNNVPNIVFLTIWQTYYVALDHFENSCVFQLIVNIIFLNVKPRKTGKSKVPIELDVSTEVTAAANSAIFLLFRAIKLHESWCMRHSLISDQCQLFTCENWMKVK